MGLVGSEMCIRDSILIMLDNSGSMSAKLYNAVEVYYPLDVATDSSGNVYVMEYYNNRIKVFDSSGAYLRSFGSYGSGCNQWQYARQFTIYNDRIYSLYSTIDFLIQL